MFTFKPLVVLAALAHFASTSTGAVLKARNNTPNFYLVAVNSASPSNLLPLRPSGGANGGATLTGSVAPGQYFFDNSNVFSVVPSTPGLVLAIPQSSGCTTYGPLAFASSTSDKCQKRGTFTLQSNNQNSQLGAQLVFQGTGGFYSCGSGKDVWYEATAGNGPPGLSCDPISLYTVPVV